MIPLAKPLLGRQEIAAASKVIQSGWVIEGPKVKEFEGQFASYVGAPHAVAVSNCTTALHLSLLVSGVKPGDVVLTLSHSFVATANSVRYCGAEPVFVDIDPHTYNIDPVKLEECLKKDFKRCGKSLYYKYPDRLLRNESPLRDLFPGEKITDRQKRNLGRLGGILVVHQLGMPCDLKAILSIAKKYGLKVVEDAACAIGSEITFDKGRSWQKIGKPHGTLACFSFHPRKILTTGEGGMITTSNKKLADQLRLLRCHGRNVPAFERTSFKKTKMEDYVCMGYNYRMTDIQASIGIVQMGRLPKILEDRRKLDRSYRKNLTDIPDMELPYLPDYVRTNWQSYPIRLKGRLAKKRDELIKYLYEHKIASLSGVTNSHTQRSYGPNTFSLPESELAKKEVILLPFYVGLKEAEILRITELIKQWSKS